MTISFNDDLRVVVKMTYNAVSTIMNVYHYEAGVGVSDSDSNVVAAIAVHLDNAYDALRDFIHDDQVGDEIEVLKRNPSTNKWTTIGVADFSGWSGDDATQPLPVGVAALVKFFSLGTGRQSRKYIGVTTEAETTDQSFTAAALVLLGNYAALVDNEIAVAGGTLKPKWWSEVDSQMYDMDGGYAIATQPSYQRRRKIGVGI